MRVIGGAGVWKVKADTIQDTTIFENPWLRRIITGIRRVKPIEAHRQAALITRFILGELTSKVVSSGKIENLNFDTAAKVTFAGFLQIGHYLRNAKDSTRECGYRRCRDMVG